MTRKTLLIPALLAFTLALAGPAAANPKTLPFAGTTTSTMSVNNGTNTGSIPAGTPYTGSLTFDDAQAPAPVAYGGGTHTVYAFDSLTFTIGSSSATSGPGRIDVFDNLTSATGYPNGDSVYVNFTGSVAPSGLLAGAAFNWMGLGMVDPSATAVTAGALPASWDLAGFPTHFSEFNYGTRGTPYGAGNTSTIQSLTSFGAATPPPPPPPTPITFGPALPSGTVGVPYTTTLTASGAGPFTYTAAGLPGGLSLSGDTIAGTPSVAGTFTVTLEAIDAGGQRAAAQVPLTIAPAPAPTPAPVYTAKDEGSGKVTSVDVAGGYIMVGAKRLIWDASTLITVNTPDGERHVIDGFVKAGMKVQWKGLADRATNTVLTRRLEVN